MSKMQRNLGKFGENLAREHLIQAKYEIISTNWHCQFGEIDIIAKKDQTLVFVEVKTTRSVVIENSFMQITQTKRERLIKAAHTYLSENEIVESDWRIDAIAVSVPPKGSHTIEHVEDALGW